MGFNAGDDFQHHFFHHNIGSAQVENRAHQIVVQYLFADLLQAHPFFEIHGLFAFLKAFQSLAVAPGAKEHFRILAEFLHFLVVFFQIGVDFLAQLDPIRGAIIVFEDFKIILSSGGS